MRRNHHISHKMATILKQKYVIFIRFTPLFIGSLWLVLSSGKLFSLGFFVIVSVLVLVGPSKTAKCERFYTLLFIFCILSILSPIDIGFKKGNRVAIRVLPTVYHLGASKMKRDLEAAGKHEDVDFVVIKSQTPFMITYFKLVIFW